MHTTSISLLMRLTKSAHESSSDLNSNHSEELNLAWSRFVKLYTPMIFFWGRKCGLQTEDAYDLAQDVLTLILKKLPTFEYDQTKSFRGWLRTITLNKLRDRLRLKSLPIEDASQSRLGRIADPDQAEQFWDNEYQTELVTRAIELMKSDFTETTWQACYQYVIEGKPAAEVANKLGVSVWTIYAAKSRLLHRLRQELDGLLE